MRIIIVGAGEVGYTIAEQLVLEKKDVVLIEKNSERAKTAQNHLDCLVVIGEGTNLDTLKTAGIENAEIFISVTDSDEVNMISCFIVANEFNTPVKLARVRNIEYEKTKMFTKTIIGIDYAVNPELESAKAIIQTIEQGATSDVFSFEDMDIQFRDIFVDEECDLGGKNVFEARKKVYGDFLIAGILRNDDIIIPSGNTKIENGDHLFVVGTKKSINQFILRSGIKRKRLKNVLIAGGGNIGCRVADVLSFKGRRVTLVDKDYDTCKKIAEKYPDITVIHGDISDGTIFDEEQLDDNDVIVTTTNKEEINILSAIYGKSLGIKRAVALVNRSSYLKISRNLGIDAAISPKISSASAVLRFIRRGNIKAVQTIFDGRAEAIEFKVSEKSSIVNKSIKDIEMPDKTLIVAVRRNFKDYIPDGSFEIKPKDDVIIFSKKESIEKLEESIIV